MTVEEQKDFARREKEALVRVMVSYHPECWDMDPYKTRDMLMGKTLKQLRKIYDEVMKEKWVYDPQKIWMR